MSETIKIVERNISDLIEAEYNPRKLNTEQYGHIKSSLQRFGIVDPILVNIHPSRKDIIIGGHQRTKVWRDLGNETIPCVELNLDIEKEKELNVRLNKNTGEFDFEMLEEHFDMDSLLDWGFEEDDFDLSIDEPEAEEDDFEGELPDEPKTELGRIYQLGKHRLMCGDSTSENDVALLMDGEKADMVFTDPPYLIQTEGGCRGNIGKGLKKQGDDIEFISNFNPLDFLKIINNVFKDKYFNAYVFCNKELLLDYLIYAKDNKLSHNVLIWKKPSAIPIRGSHRPDIEYLLLFRKSATWNGGLEGVDYSRCLEYGRETGLHPTMKPTDLVINEIKISSKKGSIVFDFFGGSGTTLIACEQTSRQCRMMELDPKYCDVIVERYCKLKGIDSESVFETGIAK